MRQLTNRRQDSLWDFMTDVEKAFDDFWRVSGTPTARASDEAWEVFTPAVDLHETKDFYLVSMDLPGVAEKDVKIDVQQGRLTVSGERVRTKNEEGLFKRFERSYGRFERSFALPQDISQEGIQARFENGVLEILVPKAEVAKPRAIAINKSGGGLFSRALGQKDVGTGSSNKDEKKTEQPLPEKH
jgi:HSP20 family protein